MAIDDVSIQPTDPESGGGTSSKFVAMAIIIAILVIGQIYTLVKLGSVSSSVQTEQAAFEQKLNAQIEEQYGQKLVKLEEASAQQLESIQQELEAAEKRLGSTGRELKKARTMVDQMQTEQKQQTEALKQEIAMKAGVEQVGELGEGLSATRTDLDQTKGLLDSTRSELGMARSELGTLIARNHDEIEQLRKLGDRDYFEFALDKNQLQRVANVALVLKKTNVKRNRFNLILIADDKEIEKKDRTINEPIFFYVGGSKRAYELVVNKVESKQVRGYISTPKGAMQLASSQAGR
jgi:hypothetical protein